MPYAFTQGVLASRVLQPGRRRVILQTPVLSSLQFLEANAMTNWTNRPTTHDQLHAIPIVRAKPGRTDAAIITATDVVGAYTHYWHGRTVMCTGPSCDACADKRTARWYGYLSLWVPSTGSILIAEITPPCVPSIDKYFHEYGTLRGARLELARANRKPNSRVICNLTPSQYTTDKLPAAPDVKKHLCRMWEVFEPESTPTTTRLTINQPTNGQRPIKNGR